MNFFVLFNLLTYCCLKFLRLSLVKSASRAVHCTCLNFICTFIPMFFSCSAVISGWETANRYQVKNSLGQQVYFAAEGVSIYVGVVMSLLLLSLSIMQHSWGGSMAVNTAGEAP